MFSIRILRFQKTILRGNIGRRASLPQCPWTSSTIGRGQQSLPHRACFSTEYVTIGVQNFRGFVPNFLRKIDPRRLSTRNDRNALYTFKDNTREIPFDIRHVRDRSYAVFKLWTGKFFNPNFGIFSRVFEYASIYKPDRSLCKTFVFKSLTFGRVDNLNRSLSRLNGTGRKIRKIVK